MSTIDFDLKAVRDLISKRQPFSTGTYPLTDNAGLLYFRTDRNTGLGASSVDLAHADEASLQTLLRACDPAPFGLGDKNVLDDTYRKAWKMDTARFSTRFDVLETGIVERACAKLVETNKHKKVRPEIYKLNVYGPGSFFKAHKDTPRGQNMFGSLVVVFPTHHEGGALYLRHKGEEWTFDSANVASAQTVPSIAYIAFYSDVEHEVSMVTSGYRVTLTYNLYFDDAASNPFNFVPKEDEVAIRTSLSSLLRNPDVLPDGGYLGFGLSYMYPIGPRGNKLQNLLNCLKGGDAIIKSVLDQLDLNPELKVIYDAKAYAHKSDPRRLQIMMDDVEGFPDQIEESLRVELSRRGGIVIRGANEISELDEDGETDDYDSEDEDEDRKVIFPRESVLWVTPQTEFSRVETSFIAHGNEAWIGTRYGNVCLVAKVFASEDSGEDMDDQEESGGDSESMAEPLECDL